MHTYSNVYFNHFDNYDKVFLKFHGKISIQCIGFQTAPNSTTAQQVGVVKVNKILVISNISVH